MTLWDFATRWYALPGVAPACLRLQDAHGVDVNQLMLAAWAGLVRGVPMADAQLRAATSHARHWREQVVLPLRSVRRGLKEETLASFHADASLLREQVKALELRAEKLQLEALEALLPPSAAGGTPDLAIANVRAFLASQAHPSAAADDDAFTPLFDGLRTLAAR